MGHTLNLLTFQLVLKEAHQVTKLRFTRRFRSWRRLVETLALDLSLRLELEFLPGIKLSFILIGEQPILKVLVSSSNQRDTAFDVDDLGLIDHAGLLVRLKLVDSRIDDFPHFLLLAAVDVGGPLLLDPIDSSCLLVQLDQGLARGILDVQGLGSLAD